MERAAGRNVTRRGRRSLDRDERCRGSFRVRQRVQESARVGVSRVTEDVWPATGFDHATGVEDGDAIGDRR
jgi:hypothetical protein